MKECKGYVQTANESSVFFVQIPHHNLVVLKQTLREKKLVAALMYVNDYCYSA